MLMMNINVIDEFFCNIKHCGTLNILRYHKKNSCEVNDQIFTSYPAS